MKHFSRLRSVSAFVGVCAVTATGGLVACNNNDASSEPKSSTSTAAHGENTMKYNNVLLTGACPYSVLLGLPHAKDAIKGINPNMVTGSDHDIVRLINPDFDNLDTSWITSDYKVNLENIMMAKPDAVFYYAQYQNDNLERLKNNKIPVYNIEEDGDPQDDPERTQIYWEKRFNELLGLPETHIYKDAWDKMNAFMADKKDKLASKKALVVWSDAKGIKVSGEATYQDAYLKMAGLSNVANNQG